MDTQTTLGSLNLFTLVAVLIVVIAGFAWFLRKRSNREGLGERGIETNLDEVARRNEPVRARDQRP